MRPILLAGHTRSLTRVKFNADGDLLFSTAKDSKPNVWYSHNGERLGTYNGHNGAVWDLDVTHDSRLLMTGSADNTCKLWDVYTGKNLFTWTTESAVRSVAFALGDKKALYTTDAAMGKPCRIYIVSLARDIFDQDEEPDLVITVAPSKVTCSAWGALNKTIYTGHEDGSITIWDAETGDKLTSIKGHTAAITDLQFYKDKTTCITSSKDMSAKVWDAETLEQLKVYTTERPVNSAAMSPLRPHVIIGGGQEAMSVTTTGAKAGKFDVYMFHQVFEEQIGSVKGHFGPVNSLAYHPEGKGFVSGGEDGYIRVHFFDPEYYKFKYPEEVDE